ncbi:MAG: hypothetical protein HYX36_12530 [Rhizobiales bacterium]|nr:hypothetical protein [Hyphomicrobiales bacterium]
MAIRFHVEPRDVPSLAAARRLGVSEEDFTAMLPKLIERGFPRPDETTGNFDLHAIDEWCTRRNPELFLTATEKARDARAVVGDRLIRLRNG